MSDLNDVIEDAVNDSVSVESIVEDTSVEDFTSDAPAEDTTTVTEDTPDTSVDNQVASPGTKPVEGQDDFDKKFGLQPKSITGRENRIPYSRVKAMIAKAEAEAKAAAASAFDPAQHPKYAELDTKVKDYEGRLERVAQFENILANDPPQFLDMLAKVPAYKPFFDFVNQALRSQQQKQTPTNPYEGRPEPNETLPDGSKVYNMEGLQALLDWQAAQVEARTIRQVEERYKPIEQAWKSQEEIARIAPIVDKQISEARQWPHFSELEPRIVEILRSDKNISLDRAYNIAHQEQVIPKLQADRDRMKQELLAEIKKAPVATTPTVKTRPTATTESGPRDLESIIKAAVDGSGIR